LFYKEQLNPSSKTPSDQKIMECISKEVEIVKLLGILAFKKLINEKITKFG